MTIDEIIPGLTKHVDGEFRTATATELDLLAPFALPNPILGFYSRYNPQNVWILGIKLLSIQDLVIENRDYVPGYYSSQRGLVVFATDEGDGYCLDLERLLPDGEPSTLLVSHELDFDGDPWDALRSASTQLTSFSEWLEGLLLERPADRLILCSFPRSP